MKTPRLITAIGHLDEALINSAEHDTPTKERSQKVWRGWAAVAACLALLLMTVLSVPGLFDLSPATRLEAAEAAFEKGYFYQVAHTDFSTYVGGKVIAADKIGTKISDTTALAGWKNAAGEQLSTETLQAELYEIEGVANDVAVAIKFLDQGEALTTTHYYVLLNPAADLTPVRDYVITPAFGRVTDENGEIPE